MRPRRPSRQEMNAVYGSFKKKVPKKQRESTLQRQILQALNSLRFGYFFRIRNGATFDPRAGVFRANTAEKGIPDLMGWHFGGKMVLIEVKYIEKVENRKKLIFNVRLSDEQKEFLRKAHADGCLSGVAFNLEDAIAIVKDNPHLYPRHPRTYSFLAKEEKEKYAQIYKEKRAALSVEKRDPLTRDIAHALKD